MYLYCAMESGHDNFAEDVVAKAVEVASIARSAKKKAKKAAKEALEVTRKELKRKGKILKSRRSKLWK